jgi:hypothetical protein
MLFDDFMGRRKSKLAGSILTKRLPVTKMLRRPCADLRRP